MQRRTAVLRPLPALALAAVLAGLAAAGLSGAAHRAVLLSVLVVALAMAAWASRPWAAMQDRPLGGEGYGVPPSRGLRILHSAVSVLYTLGIIIVVYALLVRLRWVDFGPSPTVTQAFPVFLGLYVFLLGLAAHLETERRGGVLRTWATRLHSFVVFPVGAIVLLLGVLLVTAAPLSVAGHAVLFASDLPVLVLIAVLGAGTQLLLAVGLPTSLDLVMDLLERRQGEVRGTPPFVYAAIVAVAAAAVVSFAFAQFDLFDRIGGFRDDRVVYIIAVVPLAMVLFFLVSALAIWREGRRGLYKKRIPTRLRNALAVYGIAAVLSLGAFALLAGVLSGGLDRVGPFAADRELAKDLTAATVLAATGPIGWYLHRQNRRVDAIEVRLPDFLNDLAESRRAGLTLPVALRAAAKTDYGALSPEVRKMANQVGWGIPFNDALQQFSQRVRTNLVRRTTQLVIEASRTGGSVSEILKAAARDAYELKNLESDRRVTMMTYLIVIYVVFAVFMVVLAALDTQFIPGVIESQTSVQGTSLEGGLGAGGGTIDRAGLRFVYFNAAMVQALGNGLVGGVLSEGRLTAGFRHVAIMTVMAWAVFRLLLGSL